MKIYISFWHGLWHDISPKLYVLSNGKNITIKDTWDQEILNWDLLPMRPLRRWEISIWDELKFSLSFPTFDGGHDAPIWKLNSHGTFTAPSIKKAIHIGDQRGLNFSDIQTFFINKKM